MYRCLLKYDISIPKETHWRVTVLFYRSMHGKNIKESEFREIASITVYNIRHSIIFVGTTFNKNKLI